MAIHHYLPKSTLCFFRDGNMWLCVRRDFVNIQESPVGSGRTFEEAAAALRREETTPNSVLRKESGRRVKALEEFSKRRPKRRRSSAKTVVKTAG